MKTTPETIPKESVPMMEPLSTYQQIVTTKDSELTRMTYMTPEEQF
jgi:hypothetical protein